MFIDGTGDAKTELMTGYIGWHLTDKA